jgi:flagellar basal body-associated protein FliL
MAPHQHDPLHALHEEVEHLVEVAEKRESSATPVLMLGGLALVLVPLVAVVVTVALATAHFATGDEAKAKPNPSSSARLHPLAEPPGTRTGNKGGRSRRRRPRTRLRHTSRRLPAR